MLLRLMTILSKLAAENKWRCIYRHVTWWCIRLMIKKLSVRSYT